MDNIWSKWNFMDKKVVFVPVCSLGCFAIFMQRFLCWYYSDFYSVEVKWEHCTRSHFLWQNFFFSYNFFSPLHSLSELLFILIGYFQVNAKIPIFILTFLCSRWRSWKRSKWSKIMKEVLYQIHSTLKSKEPKKRTRTFKKNAYHFSRESTEIIIELRKKE